MFKNLVATHILFYCESIFTIKPQFQRRIAELSCKHNYGLKRSKYLNFILISQRAGQEMEEYDQCSLSDVSSRVMKYHSIDLPITFVYYL